MSENVQKKSKAYSLMSRLSKVLYAMWQNKLWVLFLVLAAMVFYAWHSAQSKQHDASATLILHYDQAYEGLNPNGTRFNVNELLSKNILETAIDRAGLKDMLSTADLLDSIEVNASGSQSPQKKYIATEYSVRLNDKYLPKKISASNMLTLLLDTYKQYFLSNYGSNDSALNISWEDVDDWEYLEFSDIMKVRVNNLITYLEDLREESGMYQYHATGESFRSLSESVSNFRDIYLNKYTSYVTINGLFKHPENYRSKLFYRRFLINQSLKNNQDCYRIYQDALGMYDQSMITFVMVPMYDAANGLYMARTSIGMDNLTKESKSYAEKIETNSKEIKIFDQSMSLTEKAQKDKEKYAYADAMIKEIENHMDSLIKRIRAVKKEYEDYKGKTYLQFNLRRYSLVSGFDVKGCLITAAITVLLCFAYYATREYIGKE